MAPNTAVSSGSLAHDETQLWKDLSVDSRKNSVRNQDSVFYDLYNDTRRRIIDACHKHTYDVVVEVGCGTGEVVGFLEGTGTPRIGVDINEDFINHCKATYKDQGLEFHVADAMKLDEWWTKMGYDKKYKAPLMVCPNNTIMIMPEEIRDTVIERMRVVAGIEGRIVVTHKKNSDLCGTFDLTDEHVDWENKKIETRTSYKSEWPTAGDVRRLLAGLHIDVGVVEPEMKGTPEVDYIAEVGMGGYLWRKGVAPTNSSMGLARDYYDNKDSQTFYRTVWGENNTPSTPRIWVDINKDFINHCKATYKDQGLEFHVADALKLAVWGVKRASIILGIGTLAVALLPPCEPFREELVRNAMGMLNSIYSSWMYYGSKNIPSLSEWWATSTIGDLTDEQDDLQRPGVGVSYCRCVEACRTGGQESVDHSGHPLAGSVVGDYTKITPESKSSLVWGSAIVTGTSHFYSMKLDFKWTLQVRPFMFGIFPVCAAGAFFAFKDTATKS